MCQNEKAMVVKQRYVTIRPMAEGTGKRHCSAWRDLCNRIKIFPEQENVWKECGALLKTY